MRIAAIALALACAASACTCRKSEETSPDAAVGLPPRNWLDGELPPDANTGAPTPGGTLVVRLPAEPAMLNKLHDAGQDAWAVRILYGAVYETLLTIDRDRAPEYPLAPGLAESWQISEDGLTTTFKLRQGVRFHDGSAFDSADVRAVIEAVLDPKHPTAAMRGRLEELASFETPDPRTVILRWKRPIAQATRDFALGFPMIPAEALRGDDFNALAISRAPVGTGPFRFASWDTGREMSLVRNDDYWGRRAYLDRVVFRFVKDSAIATQLFERGEFDLMVGIPPTVWRALETPHPKNAWAQRGYHRIRFVENAFNWIGWNQARPPLDDARVRRALAHLVPIDAALKNLTLDLEVPTTCPYYSPGPACDPALEARDSPQRLRHDPERARALLREAGWTDSDDDGTLDKAGVPLKLSLMVTAQSVFAGRLAPLLQEEFRRAGVALEIERAEWAVFMQRVRQGDFDGIVLGSAAPDVETDVFAAFHSSQRDGGSNYVRYANPEVDALLEEARATVDPGKRRAAERRIHRAVYEDQAYTFLGARVSLDAVKIHVRGLRPSIGWYRLADAWLARSG